MASPEVLAATLVEPGKYELRDYPLPTPAPGCLLVRMEYSGICGTDKHTYQGFTTQYAGSGQPRQIPFPIIQGHENVGTIAAIGGDAAYTDFEGIPVKIGDHVVIGPHISRGNCFTAATTFLTTIARTPSITATTSARNTRRIFLADGLNIFTFSPTVL